MLPPKSKQQFGCVTSLFQCFQTKKKRQRAAAINKTRTAHFGHGELPDKSTQDVVSLPLSPQSPNSVPSAASVTSEYFEALEEEKDDWREESMNVDDYFEKLQIDDQYFFSARDDPKISQDIFLGVKMYPPIPTTEPDPTLKHVVSISNMKSLLYSYQHSFEDAKENKLEIAHQVADIVGEAMEQRVRCSMTLDENTSPESVFMSHDLLMKELELPDVSVSERGYPGELTEKELKAVKLLCNELRHRDPIYNEIVFCLSPVEKKAYALCRFLRARKFEVEKVFELLDQAKDGFVVAKKNDFYPDLAKAVGVSRAVFLSQYPAVFSGNARNGCPVMYLKAGAIQPEGVKCIVSFEKVDRWFWSDMMYTWLPLIKEGMRINPNLVRCENIAIYDLKGVSKTQITSDTFETIKIGTQVMTSFPETLHCMLIINAPSWFGLVWSVVKNLIDPRTASKIEVFVNVKNGFSRMCELIETSQIPSDYGGSGPTLSSAASAISSGLSSPGNMRNVVVLNHLVKLSKRVLEKSLDFEVGSKVKPWTLNVYSRCIAGVKVSLYHGNSEEPMAEMTVIGQSEDEPYSSTIGVCAEPGKYQLRLSSASAPGDYLIIGTVSASDE